MYYNTLFHQFIPHLIPGSYYSKFCTCLFCICKPTSPHCFTFLRERGSSERDGDGDRERERERWRERERAERDGDREREINGDR